MDVAFSPPAPPHDATGDGTGRPVYLESDFYMDVDDVGALAIALHLQQRGEIDLIGFGINAPNLWGAHTAAILRHVYQQDFPIGARAGIAEEPSPRDYANARAVSTAYRDVPDIEAEDGTALLRRVLAEAEDDSVTIASVGFFRNLVGLLRSAGDQHSELAGPDLVRAKVARTFVMGGVFPSGREHNIAWDPPETAEFLAAWPGDIDFIGFEAADRVITARGLSSVLGADSPVALAYSLWGAEVIGRPSWDPLTVFLAARPDTELVGWSERGRIEFHDDGTNGWQSDPAGAHRYAVPRVAPEALAAELDGILRIPPAVSPERAAEIRGLRDGRREA